MALYNKLKEKLFLNRYIIFLFVCIVIASLRSFDIWHFDIERLSWSFEAFSSQEIERRIMANVDVLQASPMQNLSLFEPDSIIRRRGSVMTSESDFSMVYSILGFHPSWILNSVLTSLLNSTVLIFIGILISTAIYRGKGVKSEGLKAFDILKKQVLAAFWLSFALVIVGSVIGSIWGYTRHHFQIRHLEEMQLLMALFEAHELWTPGIFYYAWAALGALIILTGNAIFGIFIGHVFKDIVFAILVAFTISSPFLIIITFQLFPAFFLSNTAQYFIAPSRFMFWPTGGFAFNLSVAIVYLAVLMFISKKLIDFRLKRAVGKIIIDN